MCCSVIHFATPWTAAHQASLSLTISQSLLKFMSIELLMPFSHLILCHPLLFLPSIFPSTRVFSNELAVHIRWPKYWNFSISPFNEYSGLISFRIYWFVLLVVQGPLKSPIWPTALFCFSQRRLLLLILTFLEVSFLKQMQLHIIKRFPNSRNEKQVQHPTLHVKIWEYK